MTLEQTTNKVTRTYSIDRALEVWVMQKASRITGETGKRKSDSELVNDILTEAMEEDKHLETLKAKVRNGGKQIKQLKAES